MDPSLCIDSRDPRNGHRISLTACTTPNAGWLYDGYVLRSVSNTSYTLDSPGHGNGQRLVMWWNHGGHNQDWELRSEREVYVWTSFRTHMGNGCLEVEGGDTTDGTPLKLGRCDNSDKQSWFYDPRTGTVVSALASDKCMDIPNFNTANDTNIVLWQCNGGENQQWELDNGVFRSRLNRSIVVDANSASHGADISVWQYHGGSNQRWRAVLH